MTSEECRLLIPQYLSGQLTPAENALFEAQLEASTELLLEVEELRVLWDAMASLPEQQPSPALRARFYQKLNAFERDRSSSTGRRFGWNFAPLVQTALALFVFVMGVYLGRSKLLERGHADEMTQMNAQVQSLRELVALSLLDRQSATSRLEGVSWSSRVERPNDELLSALLTTLNHDPNVNVRLSSLDALERFSANPAVRKALIDSIPSQDSPLVQIALIDSLVHNRDRAAAPELKKLSADTAINPSVRQRAQWGVQNLNFE